MHLFLDPVQAQVVGQALGQAIDNEREQGDEGLGIERIERLQPILEAVDVLSETSRGGVFEVDFLALDVLAQYLQSLEGMAETLDDFGLEHEEARKHLILLLDDLSTQTIRNDDAAGAPIQNPTIGQLVSTAWSDDLPHDLLIRPADNAQAQACVAILLAAEGPLLSLPPASSKAISEHLQSLCQALLDQADEGVLLAIDPQGSPCDVPDERWQ